MLESSLLNILWIKWKLKIAKQWVQRLLLAQAPTDNGNGIHGISVSETSRRWRGARRQLPFRVVCWDWRIKHIITSSSYRRVFSCRRLSSSHLPPSFPWVHRSWEHPFYRPTSCLRNPWLLEYCTYTGRAVVSRRRELKVLSTREFMAAINYNSQQSTLHLFGWIPALQKLSTKDPPPQHSQQPWTIDRMLLSSQEWVIGRF